MTTVGVTGGIGSGKSTVCRLLAAKGARIFDADAVAKELMTSDPQLREAMVAAFGEKAYLDGGRLDRHYLAERIFSDDEDRARMNAIVHPAVGNAYDRARRQAQEEGVQVLVREAAILPEPGTADVMLAVLAPANDRIRRVARRDGMGAEDVQARIRAQADEAEYRRLADAVIVNDGSLEDLVVQVDDFWHRWLQENSRRTSGK